MSKTRMQGDGESEDARRPHKAAYKFIKARRWDKAAYDAAPRTVRDAEDMRHDQADAQADGPARAKDHHAPAMEAIRS